MSRLDFSFTIFYEKKSIKMQFHKQSNKKPIIGMVT